MNKAEQGDILRISGINWPVIVVSNNHFNTIGEAIVSGFPPRREKYRDILPVNMYVMWI